MMCTVVVASTFHGVTIHVAQRTRTEHDEAQRGVVRLCSGSLIRCIRSR